jgi:hypothetical protein
MSEKKPRWQRILDLEAQARGLAAPQYEPPPQFDPTRLLPESQGERQARNGRVVRNGAGVILLAIGVGLAFPGLVILWLAFKIFH